MEIAKPIAKSREAWFPLALLLACYALFDFFVPGMVFSTFRTDDPSRPVVVLILFLFGGLSAQLGALVAWGALGAGHTSLRWLASLLAAEGLACLFLGGVPLFSGRPAALQNTFESLLVLPFVFLCAQIPLGFMRLGWGYRIIWASDRAPPPQRFSLQSVFLATTIIAVALACLRIGVPAVAAIRPLLVGLAGGTLVIVPCLFIAFRASSTIAGALFTMAYIAVFSLVIWIAALAMRSKDIADVVISSTALFGAAVTVLHASLHFLKTREYSLHRIRIEPTGSRPMKLLIHPSVDDERLAKIKTAAGNMAVVNAVDAEEAMREIVDADAFFGKLTPGLLAASQRLRWVQSPTASLEHYIFPELVEHPAVLTNMRGLFSDVIADQVLGYILCFARNLHLYIRNQLSAKWAPVGGEAARASFTSGPGKVGDIDRAHMHLADATLGIVGLGAIGSEIARRGLAFGMRVLAVDPVQKTAPEGVTALWPPARLPDLLLDSDFVVIAAPHTPHTEKLFRREQFRQMRRTSYFINIGRGAIVDLADLTAALEAGEIAGAALDVFEIEPLPADHPLWKLPNVILTPHVAGYSPRIAERHLGVLLDNIGHFIHGEPLENVVDKALWF